MTKITITVEAETDEKALLKAHQAVHNMQWGDVKDIEDRGANTYSVKVERREG